MDIARWLEDAERKLIDTFAGRLLFFGLQGSHARGEATDESDIDLVTVLDELSLTDLDRYRESVLSLPQGEKACGFICGVEQLRNWPVSDVFPLYYDTRPIRGRLDDWLPRPGKVAARAAAEMGAANLYHALCHRYLYGDDREASLRGFYKSAFFVLQAKHFAQTGRYLRTKAEAVARLEGADREIALAGAGMDRDAQYRRLIDWCAEILADGSPLLVT